MIAFRGRSQATRRAAATLRARTGSDEQAKLAVQTPGHVDGFSGTDSHRGIQRGAAQQRWNETLACDTFDAETATALGGLKFFLGWFHGHDLGLRKACLDGPPAATQRTARAVTSHKGIDRPRHLLENLRARVLLMVLEVELVLELLRQEISRIPRRHFAGAVDAGLIRAAVREENDFCAEPAEQMSSLDAGALAHEDAHAIATRGADHGEGDARVAAGAFEDDGTRPEQPPLLGVSNHTPGKTILDAAAGVQELALGIQRYAFCPEMERDQRRVADERKHRSGEWVLHGIVHG